MQYNVKFIRLEEKSMNNLNVKQVHDLRNLPILVNEVQRIFIDKFKWAVTFSMRGEGDGFFDGGKR